MPLVNSRIKYTTDMDFINEGFFLIHKKDNVAIALNTLKKNDFINLQTGRVIIQQDIQMGHKFAVKDINEGDKIIKYGYFIGIATDSITAGMHVHFHNLKSDY
jgi:altronate hydrolase